MNKACLVFSLDNAYIMPFKVFYHSLEETNSIPKEVSLFILHQESLDNKSKEDLSIFLENYGRKPVYLNTSSFVPSDLPIRSEDHVSAASFYRLFIGDILPAEFDHAVYLDADMLALKSVSFLFEEDVSKLIAATDHCSPSEGMRIWGDRGGSYFQAGVLVIPAQRWRTENVTTRFIEVLQTQRHRIKWWDQDVLNIALGDDWQRLPIWCNTCEEVIRRFTVKYLNQHALLIHYSGSNKPWNAFDASPFTSHWDKAYEAVFGKPFDRDRLRRSPPSLRKLLANLVRLGLARVANRRK